MDGDRRLARAKDIYEQAVFGGDPTGLAEADRDLDGVEADLSLARGRVLHARFLDDRQADPRELALFERAVELYRRHGDVRAEAEALFWVGIFHQVVRGESAVALPLLERSYDLARQVGDKLTMSYAGRHIGFAQAEGGRVDAARDRLEESVRLRRELGFQPGVAAGLLALAELAARAGDRDDAQNLLAEADAVAVGCGADGIRRWIGEARKALDQPV